METRFAVDRPLGRLARWLRLLGRDAVLRREMEGRALLVLAAREERVVLTRDERLVREPGRARVHLLRADRFREQVREMVAAGLLDPAATPKPRCTACNGEPHEVASSDLPPSVPMRVRESGATFSRCPGCGRIAWDGSQADRIGAEIAALGLAVPPPFRRPSADPAAPSTSVASA
ncbi:MAG: Mut7-C RNAse domain-containing protein [Alphaproteobacteria bacterium]